MYLYDIYHIESVEWYWASETHLWCNNILKHNLGQYYSVTSIAVRLILQLHMTASSLKLLSYHSCLVDTAPRGRGTPIIESGREFPCDWLPSLIFSDHFGYPTEKMVCFLSHLVPEIIGPNIGLIVHFHQNMSFKSFKTYCINFLLDFQSSWPSFLLILKICLTLH